MKQDLRIVGKEFLDTGGSFIIARVVEKRKREMVRVSDRKNERMIKVLWLFKMHLHLRLMSSNVVVYQVDCKRIVACVLPEPFHLS